MGRQRGAGRKKGKEGRRKEVRERRRKGKGRKEKVSLSLVNLSFIVHSVSHKQTRRDRRDVTAFFCLRLSAHSQWREELGLGLSFIRLTIPP